MTTRPAFYSACRVVDGKVDDFPVQLCTVFGKTAP